MNDIQNIKFLRYCADVIFNLVYNEEVDGEMEEFIEHFTQDVEAGDDEVIGYGDGDINPDMFGKFVEGEDYIRIEK